MTTVRDIINGHLRLIEELGAGEVASAEDANDALTALNSMIESWQIQGGVIFTETIESFPLIGGTATYTMGTGGTFNTSRPNLVRAMTFNLGTDTFEYDLEILSLEEYAAQEDKTTQGTPRRAYVSYNYPLCTIIFHPVPLAGVVKIYSDKPLTSFSSLNETVSLPPGYERALRYNLAVERAPEYGKQASPTVVAIAVESRAAIENKNKENDKNTMRADQALLENKTFNIFSGI